MILLLFIILSIKSSFSIKYPRFSNNKCSFIQLPNEKHDKIQVNLEDIPIFKVCSKNKSPFTININNEDVILLFLDYKDAINFMNELSQRNLTDVNKPTMMRICVTNLNEWYDRIDPKRQHIKTIKYKLVPSSNQLRYMYDYVSSTDISMIPLFYCPSMSNGSQHPSLLMFFDYIDLISYINQYFKPNERDLLKNDIKVVSFIDFILSLSEKNDIKSVKLVPSNKSINFCREECYSSTSPARLLKFQ